ncbi:glucosidase II beta subunit-like protein-domain-containing protein [Calycina marina]|uniref:Endoplasmic reticulum lectin n=1 Tax=Calycina marina TaxID=1763456 RepID=A0A9P7YX13_9HELO|nr:glucosidase II beta subunit-like protein-domain-containing protein [Calycina marina]
MPRIITALLVSGTAILASQTVFSVHDDLLAFPQYEVVFSDNAISIEDADLVFRGMSSSTTQESPQSSNTKSVASNNPPPSDAKLDLTWDRDHQKYEMMTLGGESYLCTIPIVDVPVKNQTAEAEARAAEQKELTRATNKGWELLQSMEGNCLYYVSGWWSYSFCYNAEIVQFHQLPPLPGQATLPPKPDPGTKQYVLGRAQPPDNKKALATEDEWGNQIEVRKMQKRGPSPKTEIQAQGDTRYLVQKLDDGTICDLTGKPRRIEVQYHCSPHMNADRIGYIKEIGTCSYLMAVYTPRLCKDVAFLPPKETRANELICRAVVPEDEVAYFNSLKILEEDLAETSSRVEKPVTIGGLVIGAGKWINKEGARLPIPPNFGQENQDQKSEIIAKAKSKAEGGKVENLLSDTELQKMDLDPSMVENLKKEVQKLAKEKGWKIEVVDAPGAVREILGSIIDDDEEDEASEPSEEGSEEILKEEL